jgi:signal-transduction protein with cAMP-binding, CBS, and nucleotidyltransferase domain
MAAPSQTAVFARRVREFARPPSAVCALGTPLDAVLGVMAAEGASSVLVVDAGGGLAGILTEHDVARRVAFRLGPDSPVEAAMSRPVVTVGEDEFLYRAVGRMRRLRLRHMPVVDPAGRPVGMLDLNEALGAASERLIGQIDRLTNEPSAEGLARTKAAQIALAAELLADRVPAPEIQALITEINLDIHRAVLGAAIAEMEASGWGGQPVPFTLLVMGSGGRGENFLHPDQDNGFILADYPDEEHGRIDAWFIGLAERFTRQLDAVGFPLCKGYVMATNPLWRKSETQWRDQFRLWAQRRSPVAILFADIFLDFRAVEGPVEPAETLRATVIETLAAFPALLAEMCRDETARSVALGFFGRIVTESTGDHPGRVDLKMRGTMPLVGSARLLALRRGIVATGTLARLAGLEKAGALARHEAEELAAAFEHITLLMLRQQLADHAAGRKVGNFVDPDTLSRRDRDRLVDSLRAVETFRKSVRAELTGEVW